MKPGSKTERDLADALRLKLLASQVDELGALEKEFAPLKPKFERIEQLRKLIRDHFAFSDVAAPCMAQGERFVAQLGPLAIERRVDVPKLARAIGAKALYAIASVTLKALAESGHAAGDSIVVSQTGARPIKMLEKGAA